MKEGVATLYEIHEGTHSIIRLETRKKRRPCIAVMQQNIKVCIEYDMGCI